MQIFIKIKKTKYISKCNKYLYVTRIPENGKEDEKRSRKPSVLWEAARKDREVQSSLMEILSSLKSTEKSAN